MDLPGGTDVAHAKLHPRLDHWYRGEATAPESKKGSTSPKRRRTSESSGSLLLTSSTTSSSTRPQRPAKKAPIPRATRTSQRNVGATAVSQVADSPATSYAITFSSGTLADRARRKRRHTCKPRRRFPFLISSTTPGLPTNNAALPRIEHRLNLLLPHI